jgi:type II secretory pathway pseudopilin PulG
MDPILIVLLVIALLLAALFIGGYVANGRRRDAERTALHARVQAADQELARAHAEDKGWERGGLESAARSAFTERHGRDPQALHLVQVVDRPGIDDDEAVFEADGERLVLGRTDGSWTARA